MELYVPIEIASRSLRPHVRRWAPYVARGTFEATRYTASAVGGAGSYTIRNSLQTLGYVGAGAYELAARGINTIPGSNLPHPNVRAWRTPWTITTWWPDWHAPALPAAAPPDHFNPNTVIDRLKATRPEVYTERSQWLLKSIVEASEIICDSLARDPLVRDNTTPGFNRLIDHLRPPNRLLTAAAVATAAADPLAGFNPAAADAQEQAELWYARKRLLTNAAVATAAADPLSGINPAAANAQQLAELWYAARSHLTPERGPLSAAAVADAVAAIANANAAGNLPAGFNPVAANVQQLAENWYAATPGNQQDLTGAREPLTQEAITNAGIDPADANAQQKAVQWYEDRSATMTLRVNRALSSITDKVQQKELDFEKVYSALEMVKKLWRKNLLLMAMHPQLLVKSSYEELAEKIEARLAALLFEPDPQHGRSASTV